MKNTNITLHVDYMGIKIFKKKKDTKPLLFTLEFITYLEESNVSTEKNFNYYLSKKKKSQFNGRLYDIYSKSIDFLYVGKNTT